MLLGIIADTHDRLDRTLAAIELLTQAGARTLVHCGDLARSRRLCKLAANCRAISSSATTTSTTCRRMRHAIGSVDGVCLGWGGEIELANKRIAVTHGHLYRERLALLAREPDYLLYGHSHLAGDHVEGKTRFINPGALHRASHFTVAVLNLETDALEYLTVPR